MNLLFLQYNNYFNRIIKKENSVDDYLDGNQYCWVLNVSFNPNDGVNTEQVINWYEEWNPDYCVIVDEENNIQSRWFVIDLTRTRNKQYRISLKRDSIVDNYDCVINAPTFIDKASNVSLGDIALLNDEGISFNSIKRTETLLKDKSKIGWIIGYYSTNYPGSGEGDVNISVPSSDVPYSSVASIGSLQQWESTDYKLVNNLTFKIGVSEDLYSGSVSTGLKSFSFNSDGTYEAKTAAYLAWLETPKSEAFDAANKINEYIQERKETYFGNFYTYKTAYHNTDTLSNLNNTYVYDNSTSKLWKVTVLNLGTGTDTITEDKDSSLSSIINNSLTGFSYKSRYITYSTATSRTDKNITFTATYSKIRLSLEDVTGKLASFTATISETARKLTDAPYKMFAIPYGEIKFQDLSNHYSLSQIQALNLASRIATTMGTSLYDIQLLPYAPCRHELKEVLSQPLIDLTSCTEGTDFSLIKDSGNTAVGFIYYGSYSNFSFDIEQSIPMATTSLGVKQQIVCDNWRICSPNYSSIYEFNVAKNKGVNTFNVDCTYKPYSPFIHVSPNFKYLYGKDFNDYRGLVCQGDFTLPNESSAWVNYQINNKNYLNAFNREIDSLELKNSYGLTSDIVGAFTGAVSGGISGGLAGSVISTGGMVGGAIGGAAASLVGGLVDAGINQTLRQEEISLAKDKFNYSIQNIQAQPNTLARTNSLDFNYKIFPVLEYYSCTEQEKTILANKLTYEGYTVRRIDYIKNFISSTPNYIRGLVIRLSDINDDAHIANDIAKEISKGVYI